MAPLKWFLAVASVVAFVIAGFQWKGLSNLRRENQTLRAAVAETKAEAPPPALESLRAQDEELARLRDETKVLARTRNEIRQLRAQKPELDKLRAANQQLAAAKQAATNAPGLTYVTAAAMSDAGLATPEATVQTIFFALRQGDIRRLLGCMAPDSKERNDLARRTAEEETQMSREISEQFKKFPGFLIAERNAPSADEMKISIQSVPGGALIQIPLRRYGSEWKVLHFP